MSMRVTTLMMSALLLAAVAACGAAGSSGSPAVAGGAISVTGAWVRAAAAGATSAAYLTIVNGTAADDALTAVSSPVARSASLHETSVDASGMAGMHQIDRIAVPAGGSVSLEPGGYHAMLMDLAADLEAGSTVSLTLTFSVAGPIQVQAEVRAS
jgi:copper(I)-binding protein